MHPTRFGITALVLVGALAACDGPMQPAPFAADANPGDEDHARTAYVGEAPSDMGALILRSEAMALPAAMGAGFTAFDSREAFEGSAPGFVLEDFEGAVTETAEACFGTFDSATDNDCYSPGTIVEGISLRSLEWDRMVVLVPPVAGVSSTVVGPNAVGEAGEIAFTNEDGVDAVGLDLLAPLGGPGTVSIELFGLDGESLGGTVADVGATSGIFWGIVSEVPISRMVVTPPEDIGVLFDDLAFRPVDAGEGGDNGEGGDDPGDGDDEAGEGAARLEVEQQTINPSSQGVIPVAVISGDDLDATQLDPSTVRFGPNQAAPANGMHVEDVNLDGLDDARFHFPTPATGLACGDTEATLTGTTTDGQSVELTSSVRVLCPAVSGATLETRRRQGGG
jgi:hypothetical protein